VTARWPPNETPPAWIVTACPTCGALRDFAWAARTGRPVKEPDSVHVVRNRKVDRIMGAPLAAAAAVVTDADFEHVVNRPSPARRRRRRGPIAPRVRAAGRQAGAAGARKAE